MAQKGYVNLWTSFSYDECKNGLTKFLRKNDICGRCNGTGLKPTATEYEKDDVGLRYDHIEDLVALKEKCSEDIYLKFSTILMKFIQKGLQSDKDKCNKCSGEGYIKK